MLTTTASYKRQLIHQIKAIRTSTDVARPTKTRPDKVYVFADANMYIDKKYFMLNVLNIDNFLNLTFPCYG